VQRGLEGHAGERPVHQKSQRLCRVPAANLSCQLRLLVFEIDLPSGKMPNCL
jgi:hypothetical protein